jgi:tetratricopeptide (TPR) repeat protein
VTSFFKPGVGLCLLGAIASTAAWAQSYAVGTRSPDGKISFQAVEDFQVNGKGKVRLLPEAKGEVDQNAIKRLPKIELRQAGIIKNDGSGRLVRLSGKGMPREVVIPEDFSLKSPANASEVPGRLPLTLVHSKKAKQTDALAPELFFVLVAGASADGAVLELLSTDWAFASLDEQLAAMQGFVASFPGSPSTEEFRSLLQQRLTTGLNKFEDGGAFKDLLLLKRFGELGRKAFQKDIPLKTLADRIDARIMFVDDKLKLLNSLALIGAWDTFLDQYLDFERYQWSFPNVVELRGEALEESTRVHARRARAYALREDHEMASKEAESAKIRDPQNKEIDKVLEEEKLKASRVEASRSAGSRTSLPKGSEQEVRFERALYNAERAIQDKDYKKAEESIQEAQRENRDAPAVLLAQAKLLAGRGQLADALPLLDRYDRLVVDTSERAKGGEVRNTILYDLRKRKEESKKEIESLMNTGDYSKMGELLRSALKMDPNDLDFLFDGGLVAGVLRDTAAAQQLLTKYLERSNSLEGDLKKRDRAWRIRNAVSELKARPESSEGSKSWFSGRKLPDGVFYCPESLAFQVPIDSVSINKIIAMNFSWNKGRLEQIQTSFDDPKAARIYRLLPTPGASGEGDSPLIGDLGKFYFKYAAGPGSLLSVQTSPIAKAAEAREFRARVDRRGTPIRLLDDDNQPEVVLPGNPFVDIRVLKLLEGSVVGTTIAGNSFFNPFLWDGVHYFTVDYDEAGRAESAQEWNADNLVRFKWEGQRLTEIQAFRKGAATPYYHRTITYSGSMIAGEDYAVNGKTGRIRYSYSPTKKMQDIKIDNDGKEWIARPRP